MRAFLKFIWFPALILSLVYFWLWLDQKMNWHGPRLPVLGGILLLFGIAIVTWCIALFAVIGRGTSHPFTAKTKRLVFRGPYRIVRNPMMWGVGAILVGLALSVGSLALWIALAFFLIFINLFIPLYEERDMLRRFGDEYSDYCRRVPRWLPRLF